MVGRARGRLLLTIIGVIAFVALVWGREEHAAALRATRATLTTTSRAVTAYRADHAGKCPASLSDLVAGGYTRDIPIDAWGRPLRLTCPGRRDAASFEVSSDGPDGLPGGLDRVE